MNPGKCRSCGASIVWVETLAGKRMPLDPEPSTGGNLVIEDGKAVVVLPNPGNVGPYYRSHFATCPNAHEHRKAK